MTDKQTEIGDIGNYYGGLWIKTNEDGFYWGIENYDGIHWEEIPEKLYNELMEFNHDR